MVPTAAGGNFCPSLLDETIGGFRLRGRTTCSGVVKRLDVKLGLVVPRASDLSSTLAGRKA
jgi:hypothetical protein